MGAYSVVGSALLLPITLTMTFILIALIGVDTERYELVMIPLIYCFYICVREKALFISMCWCISLCCLLVLGEHRLKNRIILINFVSKLILNFHDDESQ